jgi:uncharacterized protein (TIGR00255 family)
MSLISMTGFGRGNGNFQGQNWVWELRSVNGRALDVRVRLPSGWDGLEAECKSSISKTLTRGSINATLSLSSNAGEALRINQEILTHYLKLSADLQRDHALAAPTTAELLGLRGVVETGASLDDDALATLRSALLAGLSAAVQELQASRAAEGSRLQTILSGVIDRIEAICREAESLAAGQSEAQRAKLADRLDELLAGRGGVDPARLEQEVALLALKSDVREELDRLDGHIAAARALFAKPEAVGRAFDFLAQEFNREANTLCSKAAVPALTRLGLDLKAAIDQLREQVQNVE